MYLVVTTDNNKFKITKNIIKNKLTKTHILKNNKLTNNGIIIQIGDSHIKCLKIIIIVKIIGMIKNMYMLLVEYHVFDKLFINFDTKNISLT